MNKKRIQETAVLIFANSAEVDARNKTSISNPELFYELTAHTLNIVRQSGLPFFHISEKEQRGNTFGERFSNAIQDIYDKGYENIITVGNDSPELRTHHLTETDEHLKLGKTVLGPTLDGGFYLMGLHRSNFNPSLFQKLPWQRVGLFSKISHLFSTNNSTLHTLPLLRDIDILEDVSALLNFIGRIPKAVFRILADFAKRNIQFFETHILKSEMRFINCSFNKGSPNLLLFPQ
ncbi:TIGR04282 family arsenosugar biosynthesis glycosyltransferase [Flagellimonas sp.]|uniref:TIGR04282 family arsenosugar biosynthesis glycosyltransferase n=1 Tax=Flagellimonas sp. TaxID=2058762 RepID=UPI003B50A9A3